MFDRPLRSREGLAAYWAERDRLDGLVREIEATEEEIAAAQARQVLLTAELVEGCRVLEFGRAARSSDASQTAVAMQVAGARRISLEAAQRYVVDAELLAGDLPQVLTVLEQGLASLGAVRAVVGERVNVPFERLCEYDASVADDLLDMPLLTHARKAARRRAYDLNPAAAQAAAEASRRERFVTVRPTVGVGVAAFTAVLPAEQAEHCRSALEHEAVLTRHEGDERSVSQIMADTLVERRTGVSVATSTPVSVGLIMNATTLLGLDDTPSELLGHGVLPASAARLLATSDNAWIRRLFIDPVDASLALADTGRRRFDACLRDFVLARDQHCRAPGCTSRITHLDHDHEWAAGGATSASNGRGYTTHCHTVKHSAGVVTYAFSRKGATHAAYTRWELPIGPPLVTLPPPALGDGSTTPEQNAHRRLIRKQILEAVTPATARDQVSRGRTLTQRPIARC